MNTAVSKAVDWLTSTSRGRAIVEQAEADELNKRRARRVELRSQLRDLESAELTDIRAQEKLREDAERAVQRA
jgi:hypothetical protein